jgi:hypothetical protein
VPAIAGIINGSMSCLPGHGDRAANATATNIDPGENARLGAGLHRATGAIRAEADAHDLFSPYLRRHRIAPAIGPPEPTGLGTAATFNGAGLLHDELSGHPTREVRLAGRCIGEKADQPIAARLELCRKEGMVSGFHPD